ncbi:MAG: immunoglobulin domain-containing protein [Blastocatellia bacterium]|nr:immunoglobulin domain-containing protein [Blastocatellia bacterium]
MMSIKPSYRLLLSVLCFLLVGGQSLLVSQGAVANPHPQVQSTQITTPQAGPHQGPIVLPAESFDGPEIEVPASQITTQTVSLKQKSRFAPRVVDPAAVYSNVTTFSGQAFSNGGTANQSGNLITRMATDNLTLTAGGTIPTVRFVVSNLNAIAVSVRPRIRFYQNNGSGGGPGTIIAGFTFNAISFGASSVVTVNGNLGTSLTVPSGTIWAGITFDNNTGATGATQTQLDNFGMGIFNPVDIGSSTDTFFLTTAAGSFLVNNPAGTQQNFGGAPVANFGWELVGSCTAPAITTHPGNATASPGGSASFTVAASGTAPLGFQWRKGTTNLTNGGNISGATTATLTINPVGSGDAASNYNCVVTNSCGSATSNNASLTVLTVQATRLFVADTYNNRVQKYESGAWTVLTTPTLSLPEAVTASIDGQRIYVADTGHNKVIYSVNGGGTWADFATAGLVGPQGLALDLSGHLYVSNTGANQVLRYDESSPLGAPTVLASGGTGAGQVTDPRGLAIDTNNRLFIADRGNSRILRIPSANATPGTTVQVAGRGVGSVPFGQVNAPEGVAVDDTGNLYVADTGNNRVTRFIGGNSGSSPVLCSLSTSLTAPPLGQVRGAEGVAIVDAGLIGGTVGQPAIVVADTQSHRLQGAVNPVTTPGPWQLVGTPNGAGTGTGQFRSPGKIR